MKRRHLRQWGFWCLAFPTNGSLRHQVSLLMGILGDSGCWLPLESSHPLKGMKSNPCQIARDFLSGCEKNLIILNQVELNKKGKRWPTFINCQKCSSSAPYIILNISLIWLLSSFLLCDWIFYPTGSNLSVPLPFAHINELILMGGIVALQLWPIPQFPMWTMDA